MTDYKFNLPVKSDQLEAIGMVATEWSYLESIVEAAIWTLSGVYNEDAGASMTTHLGMPLRLDMLMTLFRLNHSEDDAKELDVMCKNIRGPLSRQRGETVHTRWVRGDWGSPMIYCVRARGKLERERVARPAKAIRAVAASIASQAEEMRQFLERHSLVAQTP